MTGYSLLMAIATFLQPLHRNVTWHNISTSPDKFRLLLPYIILNINRLKISFINFHPQVPYVFKD